MGTARREGLKTNNGAEYLDAKLQGMFFRLMLRKKNVPR